MKIFCQILLIFISISCKAQQPLIEDLSNESKMNYTFALLDTKKTVTAELYNQILYVTIYQIYDPQATPDNFSPTDGDDVLESYIISVKSSDTYSSSSDSKLYKLKGLYNPKVIEVAEMNFPKFSIKIEYGRFENRKIEVFEFEGVN